MGKIKLDLRVSQSKYYSTDDPENNKKLFDITKQYLQTILDTKKYLFLETALTAYGFDPSKFQEQKLRSAWFAWDKRNKVRVYLVNHKILERKNTRTGKKYYKNVQSIVFEVNDNYEYAEEYARQSTYRTIKKHEALKCSDKPKYIFDDFNPVAAMKKYTGPVPC